jgi:hypothetical protein
MKNIANISVYRNGEKIMTNISQKNALKGRSQTIKANEVPITVEPKRHETQSAPDPIPQQGNGLDREAMVAVAAYYRAERRGFNGGDPLADWFEAEAEVDALLH